MNEEDIVILWEAPKIVPPEFRLYYDDSGSVICYTGDKTVQGNYIVVDAQTFAEGRHDLRIIDGKISRVKPNQVVHKLMPDDIEGIACHPDDMGVIVETTEEHIKWKLNIYEL